MIKNTKRVFLKNGVIAWVTPVVVSISLPTHAQMSPSDEEEPLCFSAPNIPAPLPDFTIGDGGGADIDPIDIAILRPCGTLTPPCSGYTAMGLPLGLSISSFGVITGAYNANGTEVFTVEISAIYCGENRLVDRFVLTINDEG